MGKIIVLPEEVRNKIAAGEVVESPLSVVKELVENSIDAGAGKIEVHWEEGGLRRILVRDDGEGIAKDDLPLTVQRYATSKIKSSEDLFSIKSLGFRGEALASIASVSRLTIISKVDGGEGWKLEVEGGKVSSLVEEPHPVGTTVVVEDLFYNVPARRKFLKSAQFYNRQIIKFLSHLSLAFPGIHFRAVSNSKEVFNYPSVDDIGKRLYQVFGRFFLSEMDYVEAGMDDYRLAGFVSKPFRGKARPVQIFFVNRRLVANREIAVALERAFEGRMERGRRPSAVLFLELPPAQVDVNVHPTKREVKFREKERIFRLVKRAVEGLKAAEPVKQVNVVREPSRPASFHEKKEKKETLRAAELLLAPPLKRRVLGQLKNLYIVVEDEDGLLIIDQHNAHEKILFERFKKNRPQPLPMLVPLVVDLSPAQLEALKEREGVLKEAGYDFELYSGRSIAIKSIPSSLDKDAAVEAFFEILEGGKPELDQVYATLACKAAVKKGEVLAHEKMSYIVEELFKTENPSLCPHGRPVVLKLTWEQIDRAMGRSGHEKD